MSEPSALAGGEGYGACEDDAATGADYVRESEELSWEIAMWYWKIKDINSVVSITDTSRDSVQAVTNKVNKWDTGSFEGRKKAYDVVKDVIR